MSDTVRTGVDTRRTDGALDGCSSAVPAELFGGLTAAEWDRLAGSHFYSTAAWLRFCDVHGGARQSAVVRWSGGRPKAALPVADLHDVPVALYNWNELLAERGLPALAPSGLLVGPRQGYQTSLLSAPDADPAEAGGLVAELRERAEASADGVGGACVAMYVTSADAHALIQGGATAEPVLLDADAWLELPAGGWDGWLETLPTRRRKNIRREVLRFERLGFRIEQVALADCYEKLPALADSTQSKYGHGGGAEQQLANLRRHLGCMGDAARVAICHRGDGDPIGFCLYYVWGETVFLRWAGFDYARLVGAAEYFNLVYYSQVMLASELGVTRIHAGIKATEAKALRGAELRPLWLVDLAPRSELANQRDAVRRHNALTYERLRAAVPVDSAFPNPDEWRAFC